MTESGSAKKPMSTWSAPAGIQVKSVDDVRRARSPGRSSIANEHHDRPDERERHEAGGDPAGDRLADALAEEQQDRRAEQRQRRDDPDEVEEIARAHGRLRAHAAAVLQEVEVVGGGAAAAPEDGHDDREADRDLGGGDDER